MMGLTEKQKKTLARNIQSYRRKLFLGMGGNNRLAEALNVSPQTISHWVCGRRYPNVFQLYLLSRTFGVTMQRLCGIPAKVKHEDCNTPIGLLIHIMKKETKHSNSILASKKRQKELLSFKAVVDYEIERCTNGKLHP